MKGRDNEFLIATRNPGKKRELEQILKGLKLITLTDINFRWEIKEVGNTFCENALIKARFPHELTQLPVISDDSGIVVPALGYLPGIYSARFSGEEANDEKNNNKLLEMVSVLPEEKRNAYYFCCAAFCYNEKCWTFTGKVDGIITLYPRGKGGFGYDPLFFLPEYNKTMAEISSEEKNRISHRGKAFKNLMKFIQRYFLLSEE